MPGLVWAAAANTRSLHRSVPDRFDRVNGVVWGLNAHQQQLPAGLLRKTKKRIVSLVWLAVQEVAAIRMNDTYKEYAGALLAIRLGGSRSTWCEIYRPHWHMLKYAVNYLDCSSLEEVSNRKQDHYVDEISI